MAQGVVGRDLAVEAGVIAIDEAAVRTDLMREEIRRIADDPAQGIDIQRIDLAPARIPASTVKLVKNAVLAAEQARGVENMNLAIIREIDRDA